MSADDQAFLDALNSVPRNVVRWSNDIADYIDTYANEIAAEIRDHLTHAQWLPESVRPTPPPPSPSAIASSLPVSIYDKVRDTVKRNKVLTGTFVVGFGASVYMMYRRRAHYARKRRAKRAPNGARLEVVVIAGSPHEPIVRSLALDLERRGFIVFIVCNDVDEELQVQNEARNDIRPLMVDVSDVSCETLSIYAYSDSATATRCKQQYRALRLTTSYPTARIRRCQTASPPVHLAHTHPNSQLPFGTNRYYLA
jgi:hypothetical protein